MRGNKNDLIFAIAAEGHVPQKIALPPPQAPKTGITSEEKRPSAGELSSVQVLRDTKF